MSLNPCIKTSKSKLENLQTPEDPYIFLYSDKKHFQVKLNDFLFVEAAGNYCKVVLKENQILIREKISDVLEILSPEKFIQVHKSNIVSKENIEAVEGNRIKISDNQFPLGKLYKMKVLDFLKL